MNTTLLGYFCHTATCWNLSGLAARFGFKGEGSQAWTLDGFVEGPTTLSAISPILGSVAPSWKKFSLVASLDNSNTVNSKLIQ